MKLALTLAEKGFLPDIAIRAGIRRLLEGRLRAEIPTNAEEAESKAADFVRTLARSPVAVETDAANEQHYEVPTRFFELVLGPRLKYSACLWETGTGDLSKAEEAMLRLTADRARIENGQSILDLGCGWGSFSLWAAERFPDSKIVAVSNSLSQADYIRRVANQRGLENVEVRSCDMNRFAADSRFDRIVSIEMLEHLRNYDLFFSRVRQWLNPKGKFFVHIFSHRSMPYVFVPVTDSDWMARHFFTGGIMPSLGLFHSFDKDLQVIDQWEVNGVHYSKTLEAWLDNQDRNRKEIYPIFSRCYGDRNAQMWFQRWRIFWMACSELFRYRDGEEWLVGHYLLESK